MSNQGQQDRSVLGRMAGGLRQIVPKETVSEFELPEELVVMQKASAKIAAEHHDSIFAIANEIAIKKRMSVAYSNFHTWEHLRNFENGEEASNVASPETLNQFQNCFYMAHSCAEKLRSTLSKHPNLRSYESCVMVATDCWQQKATSAREYHCIAMLPLPTACIIIDPVAASYAITVPLNHKWSCELTTYRYCYAGWDNVRFLFDIGSGYHASLTLSNGALLPHGDPFRSIKGGWKGGVSNLVYPGDNYRGRTPSNRSMFMFDVWDREATNPDVDCVELQADSGKAGKFLVETARLGFSFEKREMWVRNIPQEWFDFPENEYFQKRFKNRKYFEIDEEGYANFAVDMHTRTDIQLGFMKRTVDNLELMQELLEALGMKEGELMRMANVMLAYWQEAKLQEPKKDLKRKR
ncbi:hypothetical protein GMOD_00007504 [Pyrenophora seminiperda CCB06]|uniref:Uncharacterized protein n=1 Tax=Pyrenophora seminiperda CCB06 TaxID=1302712 RepID=A0A3M7MDH6_9PLEO|nr:hypothetical protein GMOD_00007504 [Pyrenophora seminiperda CCB06]